jgi:2-oxoglutarate dehydrogenase complex dehydrogenase (E1) component-like enzyme
MHEEGLDQPPPPRDREGRPGPDGRRPPPPWPYRNWESLEKTDPEMYKAVKTDMDLDRLTRELAMQYPRAPSDQRDRIKKEVEKAVAQQFEVRQQRRVLELKRLENELLRLHEAMDRRGKAREQLIQKRVSELLGHDDQPAF